MKASDSVRPPTNAAGRMTSRDAVPRTAVTAAAFPSNQTHRGAGCATGAGTRLLRRGRSSAPAAVTRATGNTTLRAAPTMEPPPPASFRSSLPTTRRARLIVVPARSVVLPALSSLLLRAELRPRRSRRVPAPVRATGAAIGLVARKAFRYRRPRDRVSASDPSSCVGRRSHAVARLHGVGRLGVHARACRRPGLAVGFWVLRSVRGLLTAMAVWFAMLFRTDLLLLAVSGAPWIWRGPASGSRS